MQATPSARVDTTRGTTHAPPMISLFVPGRLCLFGEHSDWAGALRVGDPEIASGACIVSGTDQGITAAVAPAADFELTSHLPDGSVRGPFRVPMEAVALRRATAAGDFFSYAAGVAAELWSRCRPPGVRINVSTMDLPIARGLSSSAAICVLTARAFNQVHRLGLDVRDEMDLAYRGELAAGSQCGRMDQACAYGKRLVLLRFDGDEMTVELLPASQPLHLLVVDLLHQKDTRRILADLHACFMAPASTLREALGKQNLALVAAARQALTASDAQAVGALMCQAQEIFDRCVAPACPSELSAPRLHTLLAHPAVRELTWGGKGVGSQGDGAAQLICRGPDERAALAEQLSSDGSVRCLSLTIGKANRDQESRID